VRLRCTNCEASFEGERDGRCPQCLRRTSVVQTMDSTAPPRDGTPAPWPDGTRCPLCIARDVTASNFHFEIEKTSREGEGTAPRWLTVRARCCDECQRRVHRLGRMRLAALPIVTLGTLAWPLSIVSPWAMRLLGLDRLGAIMMSTLLCAVVVGVPLIFVDQANRALRKNLEASWLFRQIRSRVQKAVPEGHVPSEHWRLLSAPSASTVVVDATELLRSDSVSALV
jgi:hypothetical protein